MLKEDERERLVQNIAGHMKDAQEFIQKRAVSHGLLVLYFQFLLCPRLPTLLQLILSMDVGLLNS